MRLIAFWSVLLTSSLGLFAAQQERVFDFSKTEEGELPAGFRSTVSGLGKPGKWQIVSDDAPSAFPSVTKASPSTSKRKVLAQTARDITDEHFPVLIFDEETYDDFTFTTQFKTVGGGIEQMAGIAFRFQDEKNYYVVRASSLGNNLRFYKFVNGERSTPIGPEIAIPKGVWHELAVECKGNRIQCYLNGKEAMPAINDTSFTKGKVGFWTKSDAVSYFVDSRITFTPHETLAQSLIGEMFRRYPRLEGLKVFSTTAADPTLRVIASSNAKDMNQAGSKEDKDCLARGTVYFQKKDGSVSVTFPVHDRNGDIIAALEVLMSSFPGQTEQNAVARATPVVKSFEERIGSLKDLTE